MSNQPPFVTEISLRASRARWRLTGTCEASIPTRSAICAVVTRCWPRAISQSASSIGRTDPVPMTARVSMNGVLQWFDIQERSGRSDERVDDDRKALGRRSWWVDLVAELCLPFGNSRAGHSRAHQPGAV